MNWSAIRLGFASKANCLTQGYTELILATLQPPAVASFAQLSNYRYNLFLCPTKT